MKGTPRPSEYAASINTPLAVFPRLDAIISAEPKNAPTQGVHPAENAMPNRTDERKFKFFEFMFLFLLIFINGMFIIPAKFMPNRITVIPVTIFTAAVCSVNNLPIEPANAPSIMKIIEKPDTKPSELKNALFLSGSPAAKIDTYTGSMGSRQGEMNVMTPSRNKIMYVMRIPSVLMLFAE